MRTQWTGREDFMTRFGAIYEHSSWIAKRVLDVIEHESPGCRQMGLEALDRYFQAIIAGAGHDRQADLLNAHPELACATDQHQELTPDSKREQSGAGLDHCTKAEFEEFKHLNAIYREKFGFPFILAVKGYQRTQILEIFRRRLKRLPETEFTEALAQVSRIGSLRLESLLAEADSANKRIYRNLVVPELGGAVIQVSDEFFAAAKRMISATEPVFYEDRFDQNGKWMDGWESRRKRGEGHDFCTIRICPGVIYGVDIDTSNFTGNFAPAASLEAASLSTDPDAHTEWFKLLPVTTLYGNSHHHLRIGDRRVWTHLRLNIFPDGGIARLRVFGVSDKAEAFEQAGQWIDLASSEIGGEAMACNDMHFGDMSNLIKPGNAINMGDGWETRRRRKPGNDWVILKLGHTGRIHRIEVDTDFFKGNNPASCSLRGCLLDDKEPLTDSATWPLILPRIALGPDQLQIFYRELIDTGPVNHVRLDIFPDGGIARIRLLGEAIARSGEGN